VERFALARGMPLKKDNHYQALVARDAGLWLVMPQTFMNASGRAVQMLAGFFKIPVEEILVVHDELDFPPGTARIKQGGGISGHNGLRDISQRLGSHDYWRLRLGVGHPGDRNEVVNWVLRKPPLVERQAIEDSVAKSLDALALLLDGPMDRAMMKVHAKPPRPKPPRPAADKPTDINVPEEPQP